MNLKSLQFPNVGVITAVFTDEELAPLKEEISEIQNNFNLANKYNKKLVGHIKKEFELIQDEQERHIFEIIKKEEEDRKNEFKTIKLKLNKILLFDRPNCGKYELILSLIQLYEENCINEYKSMGFIAQDVMDVIPNAASTMGDGDMQVDYNAIVATLTKAIQEQNALIKSLERAP